MILQRPLEMWAHSVFVSKLQKLLQKWQKIGAHCCLDDFSKVGSDTAAPSCHHFYRLSIIVGTIIIVAPILVNIILDTEKAFLLRKVVGDIWWVGKKGQSPLWHQLYFEEIWRQQIGHFIDLHHTVFLYVLVFVFVLDDIWFVSMYKTYCDMWEFEVQFIASSCIFMYLYLYLEISDDIREVKSLF